jgi:hypothetical protein
VKEREPNKLQMEVIVESKEKNFGITIEIL